MSIELIVLLSIICIGALVGTVLVGLQESKRQKQYEQEGGSPEDELQRSREYETKSLKSNVPILTIIYIVTFLLAILAMFIFVW
ncbi:hypothetical protein [Aquibacillus kalidii]|uniref:hypothetical protein n=1 Tax=Aquibacillus kalidii TaxID=2762597 RepID=UPI001646D82D|nr:hypothetical protein [Aquibacillus kalidii]